MSEDDFVPGGWTADDAVIADLRSWLVERGFVVVSDRYDAASFGDQEIALTRPIAVRLVRDRGQWWIDVLAADGRWAGIERWRDGSRGSDTRGLSPAEQADILRTKLAEIEQTD